MIETISTVHCEEVGELLEKIQTGNGLPEDKLSCCICHAPITSTNFGAVTRKSGKILFSCDSELCYSKFITLYSKD